MQKVNTTKSHDEPTPKENKEKNQKKNPKSDQANAYPSDYERYYVIDRLNLGEPTYDSENDSKWFFTQRRKGHMAYKENINNCTNRECNVLYSYLKPTKCTKSRTSHYSPILQGCMNTCSGRAKFKCFLFLLESRSSSTILMGNMTSKLKTKEREITMWKTKAGKFTTSKKVNVYLCLP